MTPLLAISGLAVTFPGRRPVAALSGVDLTVGKGEVVALVGESGSGKSVTSLATMGLLPPNARVSGQARFARRDGTQVDLLDPRAAARARGVEIAMIFQEPMTSLNPVMRVGEQIGEGLRVHERASAAAARARARELLARAGIPDPDRRLDSYPHEMSGGMRQRAMIAMALACRPSLLIADEPTTALDVTIQAQILDVLRDLQRETGMAVLFITHDLGVVAEFASRTVVMYAGRVVETGPTAELLARPRHPYTAGLLASMPALTAPGEARRKVTPIPGQPPDMASPPPGCAFAPRCAHAKPGLCDAAVPELGIVDGRAVRCARVADLALEPAS
ncbi:MAG: ABC transporter ATP-binding protein [Tagaea sp.]|nr:ABC transporter ATP-binding protein [Tagaea sp.]